MTALLAILAFVLGLAAAAKDLIQSLAGAVASVPGSGFLGEFILSESGRVNPEQGFRLAWAAGVIVAAMVVLGTPPPVAACPQGNSCSSKADCEGYCRGASNHQCSGYCSNSASCYCTG